MNKAKGVRIFVFENRWVKYECVSSGKMLKTSKQNKKCRLFWSFFFAICSHIFLIVVFFLNCTNIFDDQRIYWCILRKKMYFIFHAQFDNFEFRNKLKKKK